MTIPFVDLKAQYESIRHEIDRAIENVIRDSAFISGPYVEQFERAFASYCGTRHAIGVSNGTDALYLSLMAYNIGLGDEVITVPNTFIATIEAIRRTGASARFIDVDRQTFNMDVSLLEASITTDTKAIIPVHLYGQPADMGPIMEIAQANNLIVIGDAAQAHGAIYKESKVGTLGDVVCYSFYPGKNLGAYGDAGAVITDNTDIYEHISMARNHGRTKKFEHEMTGGNYRMDGLQASILSVKLSHLSKWTEQRRKNARLYDQQLESILSITTPYEPDDVYSVYHLYVIRTPWRDALIQHLTELNIATGIHYPIPLHRQPVLAYMRLNEGTFPVSEQQASQILSLPMFPELTEAQITYVTDAIQTADQVLDS